MRLKDELIIRLSVGEIIAIASVIYFTLVAVFNAGYFESVPGHFLQLFTLADLIGANLPILQYLLSILFAYCLIAFFGSWLFATFWEHVKRPVQGFILTLHLDSALWFVGFGTLILLRIIASGVIGQLQSSTFTITLVPDILFHGFFQYALWVGYERFEVISLKTLLLGSALSAIAFTHGSGYLWLRSEIRHPSFQSLITSDGNCLDRSILRSTSGGYLLYSGTLNEFEFRSRDTIKIIYQRRGCV